MNDSSLTFYALPDIPLIKPGAQLAGIIYDALATSAMTACDGDIFAIAQKIVSKAENRLVDLNSVKPSRRARELAREIDKDPRLTELILSESREIIRKKPGVIIVEHRSGVILANAGIDRSNVGPDSDGEWVTLLPADAAASAHRLREELQELTGHRHGVIITDSVGRPWRMGTVGIALACSGVPALRDLRGETDLFARELEVTETADADSLASGACLQMGEGRETTPVVLIRGWQSSDDEGCAALLRRKDEDLFR